MTRFRSFRRPVSLAVGALAAAGGFATAALVGVALARTFTLQVAKGATVNGQRENIVVNSRGFAVYTLSGDSRGHSLCTRRNGCFSFWTPVTVASARKLSKGAGVKGKLGVWRRDGFLQITLAGHPLYRYVADTRRRDATGEGIRSFGGTWHVIRVGRAAGSSGSGSVTTTSGTTTTTGTTPATTTTTTTTTTATTPSSCLYPPCY